MILATKWIPKVFREYGGTWTNFINKFEENYNFFLQKIKDLRYVYTPERTQSIDQLGENIGAYISTGDDDRAKVSKVSNAFFIHKNLPVFKDVYKPFIDSVLGGNSSVYKGLIFLGAFKVQSSTIQTNSPIQYNSLVPSTFRIEYQSFIQSNAYIEWFIPTDDYDVEAPKGAIYIDLSVYPTTEQLEKIVSYLRPLIPVYYNVYLGVADQYEATLFTIETDPIQDGYLIQELAPTLNNFVVLYFIY